MPNFQVPYAPSQPYRQNNTIAQLILQAAAQQAEGQRRGGAIWGNAVQDVGAIAGNTIRDIAEGRARQRQFEEKEAIEAPIRADQARLRGLNIRQAEGAIADADSQRAGQSILSDAMGGTEAAAMERLKDRPDLAKKASEYFKMTRDRQNLQLADTAAIIRGFGDDPEAAKFALSHLKEQGMDRAQIDQIQAGFDKNPESISAMVDSILARGDDGHKALITKAPEPSQPRVVGRSLVGPDGKVIYRDPESRPAGSDNKIWVMRPGEGGKMQTVFVPESQVMPGDQPANTRSGEGRPSLGGEKTALGFFNRAKQADEELKDLTKQITQKGLGGQAWMALAPNWLQTQEGQAYQQAQRAFTEARLRKDSGAAIPETEFANDRKTYFAQPGDSPETAQQKERGRAAVLSSLAFQSGRALNEFYGEDAPVLMEQYKLRQDRSVLKETPASSGVSVQAPDGKTYVFKSAAAADAFRKRAGIN